MTHARACLLALALALGLAASPVGAAVRVSFIAPDRYSDADRAAGILTVEKTLAMLAEHLRELGRRLPEGQDVEIQVLDVDLAGRIDPRSGSAQPRIVEGSTWPRFRLRYRRTLAGRTLDQGEEVVADPTYLMRPGTRIRLSGDPLRFEKVALQDWFERRFLGGSR